MYQQVVAIEIHVKKTHNLICSNTIAINLSVCSQKYLPYQAFSFLFIMKKKKEKKIEERNECHTVYHG